MARLSTSVLLSMGVGLTLSASVDSKRSFGASANSIQLLKRTVQTIAFPGSPGEPAAPRVNWPFFDQTGQLRWANALVHTEATGACDTQPPQQNTNGYPIHPRQTKLLTPRVDERLCSREGTPTEIALIGIDSDGKKSWERQTAFPSGTYRIDQRLIGASTDGLVLSSLEVWSPKTGETLMPAATRAIAADSRAVPLHTYTGAAFYHPVRNTLYVFEANVTLTARQGGLYEINPSKRTKTLVQRVVATLLGGFDRIEAIARTPDGRYLALAQRLEWRGPTDVSFAIFDLSTNRLVFHERFCDRSKDTCADPHVVIGTKGAIGFSYANMNRREHQLLLYELTGS